MLLLLAACTPEWSSVALEAAPVVQRPDFGAEACVESALRRLGYTVDQDDVFDASGLDPLLGRGQNARELRETLLAIGFHVGAGWYRGDPADEWPALHADLVAGFPSIVYGQDAGARLVTGYSALADTVLLLDPTLGAVEVPRARFLESWASRDEDGVFVIRLRLDPRGAGGTGRLSVPPASPGVDAAQLAQAVRRARQIAPVNATIRVVPPFVLIGDEPAATVDARAAVLDRTIEVIRADYFAADLAEPWEIWLFRGADSYRRNTFALFGEYPDTPYGFADGNQRALVMDISRGGGTLVHELIHPYLNENIPWVPTWFNEGLASLFEQVGEEDGHLVGYLNWRLPTLQVHIDRGDVPPLATFMAQDAATFRGERVALNYAMARYLCYYLQEQGLLQRFYQELRAHPEDPTGYGTFLRVVGDVPDFQRRWEEWARGLVAP